MAIQFPGYFVVARNIEIKKINLVPGDERCALLVDRIEVPIDVFAVVEVRVPEQTKPVMTNLVRLVDDCFHFKRQMLLQKADSIGQLCWGEKECAR